MKKEGREIEVLESDPVLQAKIQQFCNLTGLFSREWAEKFLEDKKNIVPLPSDVRQEVVSLLSPVKIIAPDVGAETITQTLQGEHVHVFVVFEYVEGSVIRLSLFKPDDSKIFALNDLDIRLIPDGDTQVPKYFLGDLETPLYFECLTPGAAYHFDIKLEPIGNRWR